MRRDTRPRPRANLLPIVVDTSRSMDLAIGRSESWRDRINVQFSNESPLYSKLAQTFETRIYGFDKRLASAGQIETLSRGGRGSRLVHSLGELDERLAGKPVAGVLLLSDGNDPLAIGNETALPDFSSPIYPVIPSGSGIGHDLRVSGLSVRQTNFEISPITITARFAVSGSIAGKGFASLTDVHSNTVIEEKVIDFERAGTEGSVVFQFRPVDVGLRFYRVKVFRESDRKAFEDLDSIIEATSSEVTLVNNTELIAVDRGRGPYKVLYLSGRPNWEFKFLRRALSEDNEVELRGLLRMAKKTPKFSFRDRDVSTTNPLFQGLGPDEEETAEQYDEPVMIRLGIESPERAGIRVPEDGRRVVFVPRTYFG